jgi:hypothetical protein
VALTDDEFRKHIEALAQSQNVGTLWQVEAIANHVLSTGMCTPYRLASVIMAHLQAAGWNDPKNREGTFGQSILSRSGFR